MQGARNSIAKARRKAALLALSLALLMRILVPAGWMPMAGNGYAITLCTGMGTVSAWVDGQGNIHKGKPADSKPDHPCIFAGLSAALAIPALDELAVTPSLATAALIVALFTVDIGRGLAAPPPPPTGPPATR